MTSYAGPVLNREALKALREAKGMPQNVLAERAGISAPYMCEIEGGAKEPPAHTRKRLADGLGVPLYAIETYRPESTR